MTNRFLVFLGFILIITGSHSDCAFASDGDDGYKLWLKYEPIHQQNARKEYLRYSSFIAQSSNGDILKTASKELQKGILEMLRKTISVTTAPANRSGGIVFNLKPKTDNDQLSEGYQIQYCYKF